MGPCEPHASLGAAILVLFTSGTLHDRYVKFVFVALKVLFSWSTLVGATGGVFIEASLLAEVLGSFGSGELLLKLKWFLGAFEKFNIVLHQN